jgi:3-hydroxyisobutyrate dehydrogenase
MTDLAFLGTGVMGLPMVRNLNDAGFAVHAYNRTVRRALPLQADGIAVFDDAARAADGCPVMVTMLSEGDAVLAVAAAANGHARPPSRCLTRSAHGRCGSARPAPVLGRR